MPVAQLPEQSSNRSNHDLKAVPDPPAAAPMPSSISSPADRVSSLPPGTTERRIMTKIDMRVLPFLCIMYLLAFLDRVNIANARVFNMTIDLKLEDPNHRSSTKFNTALVIFFVPYCLLEIPSNILLKKFKPHVWLSLNMFLFGLVTIIQGLVTNYAGLLTTRFFLGVFEAGIFPGSFYLISMWYRRHEAQKRFSFFFSSTSLAGAFGGLLAAAIGKMNGLRGYSGWRWIFIIEGTLTVLTSFFIFFLLPDFPEHVKWLSHHERAFVTARLRADQGNHQINRPIKLRDVANVLKEPKVLLGGLAYFCAVVTAYGFAYFAPTIIIQNLHYTNIQTQLRSVPPWAVAFVVTMCVAYLSDRTRHRYFFVMAGLAIASTGFVILLAAYTNQHAQYAALFLVATGAYTAMPIIVCWFNMNFCGHHRRAIASAWQVGFGNLGGIISVYVFLQRDSPRFIPGYSVCLAMLLLCAAASTAYAFLCRRSNHHREKLGHQAEDSLTQAQKNELGDCAPSYRYLL